MPPPISILTHNRESNDWHVKNARKADIAEVVEIHQAAFPDAFLTQLGPGFLKSYYTLVLNDEKGIFLVATSSACRIGGFVSGFTRPWEFYRMMLRNSWRFTIPVLLALVRQPRLFGRVYYNMRRVWGATPGTVVSSSCELSSIAVAPDVSGQGLGKELVHAFLQQAWANGADRVYLTTEAEHNEEAIGFYSKLGFRLRRTFRQFSDRLMNEYVHYSPFQQRPGTKS